MLAGLGAPVLILHGTADETVPVEQTREYERAAHALGKRVTAAYFEGIGHPTSVLQPAGSAPASQAEARGLAIAFLREHLLEAGAE